jgi:hypothetical protein
MLPYIAPRRSHRRRRHRRAPGRADIPSGRCSPSRPPPATFAHERRSAATVMEAHPVVRPAVAAGTVAAVNPVQQTAPPGAKRLCRVLCRHVDGRQVSYHGRHLPQTKHFPMIWQPCCAGFCAAPVRLLYRLGRLGRDVRGAEKSFISGLFAVAGAPGFEPRLTESETAMPKFTESTMSLFHSMN